MLIKGIFTNVNGSIGGMTASHNKGGQYLRARTSPTNPQTNDQIRARMHMSMVTAGWALLTAEQRDDWNDYASEQNWTNRMGDSISLQGQNLYIGSNTSLLFAGLDMVNTPPLPNLRPEATFQTLVADRSDNAITFDTIVQYTAGDRVTVQLSLPHSPGITNYKGPWRLADSLNADEVSHTVTLPAGFATGSQVAICLGVVLGDGRYSSKVIARTVVVA